MITKQLINSAIRRLVETYRPLKIYIFGSYAWGQPTDDSDLDLMVIVDHTDQEDYRRSVAGHHALWGLEIPKDILVYTQKEFENESTDVSTLCHKVKKDGLTVYAKP